MSDYIEAGAYIFDLVFATLILLSAFMAFARGFIREVTSVFALAIAAAAAFAAWFHLGPALMSYMPEGVHPMVPHAIAAVTGFLIVYALSAWFGRKFSRFVHAATDIGFIDRIIGFIFGLARGCLVVFLILVVVLQFVKEENFSMVSESYTYQYFVVSAEWVADTFPAFTDFIRNILPTDGEVTE